MWPKPISDLVMHVSSIPQRSLLIVNEDLIVTVYLLALQYKKHRSSHAHTNNFAKSVVNLVDSVSTLVFLKLLFVN